MTIERRVYRKELRQALGFGSTWFGELQKRGVIPKGHRDPGGRREFWPEAEAREIIARLNSAAHRA